MSKFYFFYGSMNSGKTAQLIMVAHNYKEKKQKVLILKPKIDNRENLGKIIKSRCGISVDDVVLFNFNDSMEKIVSSHNDISCILVDESQFLTKSQVCELSDIVDNKNIPVMCYGLRADFKGELFEGSKWLLAYVDEINEIKTVCWCGRKATFNARMENGKIIKSGESIKIGGNESYIALCRKHWKNGIIE